jgi:F420-dependent oxidoreductase-like protein
MRLSMQLNYTGDFVGAVAEVQELERAGLDMVWVAEAYSFDAVSRMGYLAAKTERVEIGSGILNVYSRSAALMAMTFAGLDELSGGRAVCGFGASGPQVIEGFHGIPYEKPMTRIRDYIEVCRKVWRREVLVYDGDAVQVPLPAGRGTGLGKPLKLINRPVRSAIPIWWAALMGRSVETTAALADGWLPTMFVPERAARVWGDSLRAGAAKRPAELGPLDIAAGGTVAIGEELTGEKATAIRDVRRPLVALYVGGMGARGKNFYNDVARGYGYEQEAVEVQDLYLDGHKDEAAAKVPAELLEKTSLVGPPSYVAERVAAYKEAGVTVLQVELVGPDRVKTLALLRSIVDGA